ncbi:halocyanin domain-containing protein [Halocatena marina]|uniref:halocyanin domain-containing protein n=1 Tax=Halocatena marina TaxID=2934937 RepID=UPI00200EE25A|nr:halocyanin domain-containing protein [Halocatena marina]
MAETETNRNQKLASSRSQPEKSCYFATDRRNFLRAVGGLTTLGLLAGCIGGMSENANADDKSASSVDGWLAESDNYDSITDMTGEAAVTIEVGPESNEHVFAPAAVRIDPETTVTWKWIGSGYHNVVDRDGQFESGEPEETATFEHEFKTTGMYFYYCTPHKSVGMKGVLIVGNDSDSTSSNSTETGTGSE